MTDLITGLITVELAARQTEAEGICSFELVATPGQALPPFEAGAHVDVHLPGGLVRQYSLCNAPFERHRYVLGVLQDPASRGGSLALHTQVATGSRLRISAPRNHFKLADGARHSVLLAGGIGVTPLLAMAEQLAADGADFEFHYAARSLARTAFVARLQAAPWAGRVQLHLDDGAAEQKLDLPALLQAPAPDKHLYVCGPGGFLDLVKSTAKAQGWADAQVHFEYFSNTLVPTGHEGGFEVQLGRGGRVIAVRAEQSVVEALAEAGVEVPVSCSQGVCGTCITRVLEGQPEHRDMYFTPEEQAANDQFTPCCSRALSARLVLDL